MSDTRTNCYSVLFDVGPGFSSFLANFISEMSVKYVAVLFGTGFSRIQNLCKYIFETWNAQTAALKEVVLSVG